MALSLVSLDLLSGSQRPHHPPDRAPRPDVLSSPRGLNHQQSDVVQSLPRHFLASSQHWRDTK